MADRASSGGRRRSGPIVEVLFSELDDVDAAAKDRGQEGGEVLAVRYAEIEMSIIEAEHEVHPRSRSAMPRYGRIGGCRFRQDRLRIRALLTLAASDVSVSAEHLAQEQDLPAKFLGAILSDLRRGGLVSSQRGPEAASSWPETPTRSRSPTSCGS